MIAGFWNKLTAPTTRFEKGNIKNANQAEAAKKVAEMESMVRDLVDAMVKIDDTPADKNPDSPGNVYGTVSVPMPQRSDRDFTGTCKVKDGKVELLDVKSEYFWSVDKVTVKGNGDKMEIHRVHKYEGSPSPYDTGGAVLEQHQWAIFDGSKVKYKSCEYFTDDLN